jgi:two-component system, chemotaxis family, sensor kinase CheA
VLERVGHELLVQYRGEIMPVLDLAALLHERRAIARGPGEPGGDDLVQVVVFSHKGAHVGLIVDQILDIVEDSLANQRPPGRRGVLGSVVIAGRVTELLDVEAVLRKAEPILKWAESIEIPRLAEGVAHGA